MEANKESGKSDSAAGNAAKVVKKEKITLEKRRDTPHKDEEQKKEGET